MTFGLGEASVVKRVEIRWPGGGTQVLGPVDCDQVLVVRQGAVGN